MKETKNETMGMRIKARRMMLGMSQEDLAEAMHVRKTTISSYENDRIDVKGSVIVELSGVLQTTPNHLLIGEETEGDPYLDKMTSLLVRLGNEEARKMLEIQLKALVEQVR